MLKENTTALPTPLKRQPLSPLNSLEAPNMNGIVCVERHQYMGLNSVCSNVFAVAGDGIGWKKSYISQSRVHDTLHIFTPALRNILTTGKKE
ncbi:UNVERIFIED_CONTAM: hypothetical protein K2H54_030914 [Gekko kuhli]